MGIKYTSLTKKTKHNAFQTNLYQHFLYLADTPGFEPVLKAICEKAKNAYVEEGILHVDFGDELILSAEPAGNIANYSEWPNSFQKCIAVHECLYFPEKGWSVFLGKHYTFEPMYLEEDASDLLNYVAAEDVLSPLADYADYWVYHPGYINKQGEPSIAFVSHEEDSIYKPKLYNVGSVFLKRMADILKLDIEIPEIYSNNVTIEKAWSWWNSLSNDWKTAFKKNLCIKTEEINEKQLLKIIHADSFKSTDSNVDLKDLTPLQFISELEEIDISHQKELSDFSPLQNLKKLKRLSVKNGSRFETVSINKLKSADLGFLKHLKKLNYLLLSNLKIKNIRPLKNLHELRYLKIPFTPVSDLSPLKALINLEKIDCSNTLIKNIEPLANLKNLKAIIIDNTDIADLSPLDNLKHIELLKCARTNVSFEQILCFVTKHLDTLYYSSDCEIYCEHLQNVEQFIEAVNNINFPTEKCATGLTALIDWKLINQITTGNYYAAVTILKTYLQLNLATQNHRIEEKLFGDAVVLLAKVWDNDLTHEVFTRLHPTTLKENQSAFNVACLYALKENKEKMLEYTTLALSLGHDPHSFKTDPDFEMFQHDTDFNTMLKVDEQAENLTAEDKLLRSLFSEQID